MRPARRRCRRPVLAWFDGTVTLCPRGGAPVADVPLPGR